MTESTPTPTPTSPRRKRRFQRQPEGVLQLTERDITIIRAVHRYRFLNSVHLTTLLGGGQGLIRRLGSLYHHGYLDRPREQIEFYRYAGLKPMVYAVGNKGAATLMHVDGVPRRKIDWNAKNRDSGILFIEHTLLIADVLIALETACRQSGRVRFIPPEEILLHAPEATRTSPKPFQWAVATAYQGEKLTLGVNPDATFGLQYQDRPEGQNRLYCFLEADRSTMPILRQGHRQTSFFRKLTAYYATAKQDLMTTRFGFRRFRVLTVTSNPERVNNLIQATRALNGGQGLKMFLYTDQATLSQTPDLLGLGWRNGQDEELIRLGG